MIEVYEMPVHVYTPEHNAYPYNYMIGDSSQRKEAVDYLKTAIEMGKEMGAEYTLISTGHAENTISRRQIQERLVETLRELAEYAQQMYVLTQMICRKYLRWWIPNIYTECVMW